MSIYDRAIAATANLRRWFRGIRSDESSSRTMYDALRDDDVFVASYPRSGNTWLRLLVADALLQMRGLTTDTQLPIHEDQVIPDLDRGDDLIGARAQYEWPVQLIKTHQPYADWMSQVIWIVRNPACSLVSYYHFYRRYPDLAEQIHGDVNWFCREFANEWARHTQSYLDAISRRSSRVCVLTYEALHRQPEPQLERVLRFVGLEPSADICRTAVANHTFVKQRAVEAQHNQLAEFFFRKGEANSGSQELSKTTIEWIDRHLGSLFNRARELAHDGELNGKSQDIGQSRKIDNRRMAS